MATHDPDQLLEVFQKFLPNMLRMCMHLIPFLLTFCAHISLPRVAQTFGFVGEFLFIVCSNLCGKWNAPLFPWTNVFDYLNSFFNFVFGFALIGHILLVRLTKTRCVRIFCSGFKILCIFMCQTYNEF